MNLFRPSSLSIGPAVALLLAGALVVAAPARAAAADDVERHRIAEERAAIEAHYAARTRECRDRFIVTSCVDDAKVERRRGLDALRARQLELDEEKRRARTAERSAELDAKAADDARREHERAAHAASAPAPREPRPIAPARETPASAAGSRSAAAHDRPGAPGKKPVAGETAEQRREREERHRASFETRQQQAEEHRQEALDKAAQRQKARPPAAPLPVPASVPAR